MQSASAVADAVLDADGGRAPVEAVQRGGARHHAWCLRSAWPCCLARCVVLALAAANRCRETPRHTV